MMNFVVSVTLNGDFYFLLSSHQNQLPMYISCTLTLCCQSVKYVIEKFFRKDEEI